MKKETRKPYHIKNISELDKFLYDAEGQIEPVLYNKFMDGMQKINNIHFDNREIEIQAFIKNLFQGNESFNNNLITWFELSEYNEMLESIRKDKDRSETSALKDVKIYKKPLEINNFKIFEDLEKQIPNFKSAVDYYRGAFAMNKTRKSFEYIAPRPILLLGDAGIGKTYFANTLAKLLNTSYNFFDSNSISTSWALSGSSPSWRGADAGLIFKTLAASNNISPLITLDEIDKLQINSQNSPFSLFHQMFEKENSKRFYDEYLKFYFDASNIIYVLTANNIRNIPDSLLSRMEVFQIPNPNKEEMRLVSQNIYTKELNGSQFFNPILNEEQLDYLSDLKPREVQKMISVSINNQLSQNVYDLQKTNQTLILVNKKDNITTMGF